MTQLENTNNVNIEKKRGYERFKENPFVSVAVVNQKTKRITNKRGNMMLVSSETGEIANPIAGFWESEEVDGTKFIKLFINGVKALAELSNAGTKVFELLYLEMQQNIGKDQIYLSYKSIDDEVKFLSRATFSRGISELIEKRFLAAMPAVGWYWVNPDYVWNGDRLAFVKEYRKSVTKQPRDQAEREALESAGQARLIND